MKKSYNYLFVCLIILCGSFVGCIEKGENLDNTLVPNDDFAIGLAIDEYVVNEENTTNPVEWLDQDVYSSVYTYMDSIIEIIDATNCIENTNSCDWNLKIYHQESVENAFVAPGGYMYISTDLLRKLESEAEVLAIIGHMMINIDQRIVTQKLIDRFDENFMIDYALGGNQSETPAIVAEIRDEAYMVSDVKNIEDEVQSLLCATNYDAQQFSTFLLGLTGDDEWYNLYPDYENREDNIYAATAANSCIGELDNRDIYLEIRGMLPL